MPAAKLDKARAKRQTSMTKAVAAKVQTPKRAPAAAARKNVAKNFVLPDDLIARGDLRRAQFRRQTGRGLSWSGVAEVALLELLARDDFDAVIERYGARARRSPDSNLRPEAQHVRS